MVNIDLEEFDVQKCFVDPKFTNIDLTHALIQELGQNLTSLAQAISENRKRSIVRDSISDAFDVAGRARVVASTISQKTLVTDLIQDVGVEISTIEQKIKGSTIQEVTLPNLRNLILGVEGVATQLNIARTEVMFDCLVNQ